MVNPYKRKPEKYSLIIIVVISAILICLPSARMQSQQVSTGPQATRGQREPVGQFNLSNIAGGFMTSEDLKGKVTVVDIWASWCHPCVEEIPIFNRLYDSFASEDVAIIGIAVESSRPDIESRIRQLGIKYPIL